MSFIQNRRRFLTGLPSAAVAGLALRLHDAGMIKSSPNKILVDGADWRFWNELKRELKA